MQQEVFLNERHGINKHNYWWTKWNTISINITPWSVLFLLYNSILPKLTVFFINERMTYILSIHSFI